MNDKTNVELEFVSSLELLKTHSQEQLELINKKHIEEFSCILKEGIAFYQKTFIDKFEKFITKYNDFLKENINGSLRLCLDPNNYDLLLMWYQGICNEHIVLCTYQELLDIINHNNNKKFMDLFNKTEILLFLINYNFKNFNEFKLQL